MERIVLFDGVCNFCNGAVNFIIGHDDAHKFKFAPLQSDVGRGLCRKYGIDSDVDSIILIENYRAFTHSSAALRIAKHLSGVISVAYIFILVPAGIRNYFYKLLAKYRYRLFGRKDVCMIPTPDVKKRFLLL